MEKIKKRSDEDKLVADYDTCIKCSVQGEPILESEEKDMDVYFCLECGHVWGYHLIDKTIWDIEDEDLREYYWKKIDKKPKK